MDSPELWGSHWGFRVNENMLGSILRSQFGLPRVPKYYCADVVSENAVPRVPGKSQRQGLGFK